MIAKFKKINNIFSYSFFEWDKINSHSFKDKNGHDKQFDGVLDKYNVFFAENGSGKSNLIKIIKNLNGEVSPFDTHWDYPAISQEMAIVLKDGGELLYTDGKWSDADKLKDKFLIFDKNFIEKYVHSVGVDKEDTAKRKQSRGSNVVYLGNFVAYTNEIDKVHSISNILIKLNEQFLNNSEQRVELLGENAVSLEELKRTQTQQHIRSLKADQLDALKSSLAIKKTQLEKTKKSITNKSKINALAQLSSIKETFDASNIGSQEIFDFTVSSGVLSVLHKIILKKDFIKEGLALIKEGQTDCPFCEQNIKNGEYLQLIRDYRSIFDEKFIEEDKLVRQALERYRGIVEGLQDLCAPPNNSQAYLELKEYANIDEDLPLCDLTADEKSILRLELSLIQKKEKRFLEKIACSQGVEIKKIVSRINEVIRKYNQTVDEVNAKLQELKDKSTKGELERDEVKLEGEIEILNRDILYIVEQAQLLDIFESLEKINKNNDVIQSLDGIYQALKTRLVEEFDKFVETYFKTIKYFVKELSPSMDIFTVTGEAKLDKRGLELAQCGFDVHYNGVSCADHMSEGEKQVIALAFFFAQLEKESDHEKIVILDDPITSFDAGKRKSTSEVIARVTKDYKQILIFTCDPLFREFCLKQLQDRNYYYIFNTRKSSSIHYTPKHRETIYKSFEADFKDIDSVKGDDENIVLYGQKLRFCLETKIKEDYFGFSQDNLSNMIDHLASKGKEKLSSVIDNKESIKQIYSYCNTGGLAHYPRDGSTSWTELRDKIGQYLRLEL